MRFATRALVAGSLMLCCRGVVAAEASSNWWPFGHHAEATAAQAPGAASTTLPSATATLPSATTPAVAGPVAHEAQMPTTPADDSHWMLNTPKKKVSWPSLHMPSALSSKSATPAPKTEANKNKWADKAAVTPKTSPMQSVKKGANSVADGTKSAWHKTVAAVTPGPAAKTAPKAAAKPAPQVASRETSPPFWKKMFGAKEPAMGQPQ